jgi:hypothetical protein
MTAIPIPMDVSILFDTPRKGQMPRNCTSTTLFTKTADMIRRMYSMVIALDIIL